MNATLHESLLAFWRLDDPNALWVLAGACLLGALAAVAGGFAVLQRRALLGDALAHAALPGVVIAFLLTGSRDWPVLLGGAAASSLLGMLALDWLTRRAHIRQEAALAAVLTSFFALGIVLLTWLQKNPVGMQAGLDKLLFGQAAALTLDDLRLLALLALAVFGSVVLLLPRLRWVVFDPLHARASGANEAAYHRLLTLLLVLAVVTGMQLVGIVLMAALLLIPAAAARFWTDRLGSLLLLSALFGMIAGALAANVSHALPRMPTGPWVVVFLALIFAASMLFGRARGLLRASSRQGS